MRGMSHVSRTAVNVERRYDRVLLASNGMGISELTTLHCEENARQSASPFVLLHFIPYGSKDDPSTAQCVVPLSSR